MKTFTAQIINKNKYQITFDEPTQLKLKGIESNINNKIYIVNLNAYKTIQLKFKELKDGT